MNENESQITKDESGTQIRKQKAFEPSKLTANPAQFSSNVKNSLILQPDTTGKFRPGVVINMLKDELEATFLGRTYDKAQFPEMARKLSQRIVSKISKLRFQGYKILCSVITGNRCNQSIVHMSRALWDTDTDASVSFSYVDSSVFCTATVYAVYMY